jgi:hypothetical protein
MELPNKKTVFIIYAREDSEASQRLYNDLKNTERYTLNMFDVRVYWGSAQDFISELEKRWADFKKEGNDIKIYPPAKGM